MWRASPLDDSSVLVKKCSQSSLLHGYLSSLCQTTHPQEGTITTIFVAHDWGTVEKLTGGA